MCAGYLYIRSAKVSVRPNCRCIYIGRYQVCKQRRVKRETYLSLISITALTFNVFIYVIQQAQEETDRSLSPLGELSLSLIIVTPPRLLSPTHPPNLPGTADVWNPWNRQGLHLPPLLRQTGSKKSRKPLRVLQLPSRQRYILTYYPHGVAVRLRNARLVAAQTAVHCM